MPPVETNPEKQVTGHSPARPQSRRPADLFDFARKEPSGATPHITGVDAHLAKLERKEGELWRISLLLLVLLGVALAFKAVEAETFSDLPNKTLRDIATLPAGAILLIGLFAVYLWRKKREIDELRGLVRGLREGSSGPPTEQQLDRLLEVVARSQLGYRELIDSFNDLVFTFSVQGEIRAANRSVADLLDLPFNEIVGHRLDEFVEEPARVHVMKSLPRFLERRNWSGVVRIKLVRTGGVRFLDCALQAIVKDGEVTGISCLARDITQERESESRFRELFESLQEGIYFTTPDGKLLDANPTLVKMLGYESKDDLADINVADLYAEGSDRSAFIADLDRVGTMKDREIKLRRKDGSTLICLDTTSAIRDSSGKVVRYQGALVDITQRREMEQRLHAEQEFARRLIDGFPDLIVVLDNELRYTFVSPRIKDLLGFTPEELSGRVMGERSKPEDRDAMVTMCHEILAGKLALGTIEYRTQHKDGSWRIFRAAASPLFSAPDAQGRATITGLVASSRDFTEFKLLEQQLIQSEKLAALGQMIAGVSHELNNPLTAILGIGELLKERLSTPGAVAALPDASVSRQLELVNEQARRAAEIVQNLLAFSRPAAVQKTPVNLSELVQRTLQLHEYSLRVNNIKVEFAPVSGLPAVNGDANQLMQVFLNLIVNAEQAIREVREHGTLRVRIAADDKTVRLTFQDDGPGIPANLLAKIFDPFFTTKRPGRGTGLGLSICMAMIKEHGGTIEAQNAESGGAVFQIALPVAGVAAATAPAPAPVTKVAATRQPASLQGRVALVVDDEMSIRELIQTGLTAHGVTVHCASSGEEALERLRGEHAYDFIVCDVKMPGLSGDQLYQKLAGDDAAKRAALQKRFVFMTGDLVDASTSAFLAGAGVRCVQKPFRMTELARILGEALAASIPK